MSARTDLVQRAFAPDPGLRKRVFEAISTTPEHTSLFEDIASYTLSLQDSSAELPPSKKRKVEENGDSAPIPATSLQHPRGYHKGTMESQKLEFEMPDVSFSIPLRKKMKLEMRDGGFLARDQKTGEGEWYMDGGLFQDAFRLPVPEKAQKQTMFILLPGSGNGLREPLPQDDGPNPEPAMFTILDNLKVQATALVMDVELKRTIETDEKFKNHDEYFVNGRRLEGMLDLWITRHTGMRKGLVEPSEDEFTSAVPESHRKGEKAYHVKAFRGTKDGFLFFLRTGLIFTPKKPILFFPFHVIKSVSYSSIVQRTFSLNVRTRVFRSGRASGDTGDGTGIEVGGHEENEFEFSHIDHADFAGIDTWVKKHGLDDESLAEGRRAKAISVNRKKGVVKEDGNGEGESELRKAEREIEAQQEQGGEDEEEEDSEDAREEDYDPGSEGESEGSGTSDDESNGGDRYRKKGGGNLVEDELGSEAEDVEVTDEGEDEEGEEGGGEEEQEEAEEEEEEEEEEEVEAEAGNGGPGVALDDEDQL